MNRHILIITLFIFFIWHTGCSRNLYVKSEPPVLTTIAEVKKEPVPGTIWPGANAKNSLFIDRRACQVNDIVTIVVSESAVGGNNASTNTSRDTSTTAGVTSFLGFEGAALDMLRKGTASIGAGGTSANSLKGLGKTSRDGNLTATMSARVIKILGSGNFVIEGRRQVTVNAEDQYLIVSGIVRPEDIASDNTILSQYITDARIVYTGKGVVDDKMRPGWLTRVVDWIWPF